MLLVLSIVVTACESENLSGVSGEEAPTNDERPTITVNVLDKPMDPSEGSPDNNRWTRWIQENAPVNVEFIVTPNEEGEREAKWNALFAAGNAPDLILEGEYGLLSSFHLKKQLMPLDDLFQHSKNYQKWIEKFPQLATTFKQNDGNVYIMAGPQGFYPKDMLYVRTDWLEELNLEVPETTDELLDVARAFAKEDPDGDGQDNTYGITLSGWSGPTLSDMFGAGKWILKDDTIVREFDRTVAFAKFKETLYDEGIVDRDFLADTEGDKADQDFVNGRVGLYVGHDGILTKFYKRYNTFKINNPDGEITMIPLPESPFGKFGTNLANPLDPEIAINAKAKDPVAVMQFIDWMISPEVQYTLTYGFPGEHYVEGTEKNYCPQLTDRWEQEVSYSFKFLELELCRRVEHSFIYSDDPLEKEFLKFVEPAYEHYTDSRLMPQYTDEVFQVTPPRELAFKEANLSTSINDMLARAIVNKDDSVEDAIKEAQQLWNKSGGTEIETWYQDWYADNKDNWIFNYDMWEYFHPNIVNEFIYPGRSN